MPIPFAARTGLVACALAIGLVGCGDPGPYEITEVREVTGIGPGDTGRMSSAERFGARRRPPADGIPGHGPAPASAKPAYTWTLPAGWEDVPVRPMQMRDASFAAPDGVDVSLLVGRPSPLLANVNRWRGFMGADAIEADGLDALVFELPKGKKGVLVDLRGTYTPRMGDAKEGQRFLGFLLGEPDHLLSVRMLGPEAAVDAAAEDLKTFLRSLARKSSASAPSPSGGAEGGPRDALRDRLTWDAPAGWSSKREASGMRVASFKIEGAPKLDVPLIAMGGDGGGLEAITGMWAQGVGAERPTAAAMAAYERMPLLGGEAVFVELEGDGKSLFGLAVFLGDRSIFLRLQGPSEAVVPHKAGLLELGRSGLKVSQSSGFAPFGGVVATLTSNFPVFSSWPLRKGVVSFQLWLFSPSMINTRIFCASFSAEIAVRPAKPITAAEARASGSRRFIFIPQFCRPSPHPASANPLPDRPG